MECINFIYSGIQDLTVLDSRIRSWPADRMLIQVFSGICDREWLVRLQRDICSVFPGVAMIGATTQGEIIQDAVTEHRTVISITLFERTRVAVCSVTGDGDPEPARQLGCKIREQQPRLAILFSSGIDRNALRNNSDCISEVSALNPGMVIAGGQAGIADHAGRSFVFTSDLITAHGSVAATLSGADLNIHTCHNDSWLPVGKKMRVTRTEGDRVCEIDHRSTREIYQYYLGIDFDFTELNNPALEFPLTSLQDGMLHKNLPVQACADGSVRFLRPMQAGDEVQFSFCDLSRLEEEALRIREQLRQLQPEGIFIYSCAARKQIFASDIVVESRLVSDIAECAGFFTSTEFYTCSGRTHCLVQNMTLLALSERPVDTGALPPDEIPDYSPNDRSLTLLKILTNLITATSQDLALSNDELQAMVAHDSMTGLYNRRYSDQMLKTEVERHIRFQEPLSLILLDIDFFKQFNDCLGHVQGDECLVQVAAIVRETLKRSTDFAFRYGGEELGCLLPLTGYESAARLAAEIRENIEKAQIIHPQSSVSPYVTVSTGFISVDCARVQISARELVQACDQQLYQAKHGGRNQVRGMLYGGRS